MRAGVGLGAFLGGVLRVFEREQELSEVSHSYDMDD